MQNMTIQIAAQKLLGSRSSNLTAGNRQNGATNLGLDKNLFWDLSRIHFHEQTHIDGRPESPCELNLSLDMIEKLSPADLDVSTTKQLITIEGHASGANVTISEGN